MACPHTFYFPVQKAPCDGPVSSNPPGPATVRAGTSWGQERSLDCGHEPGGHSDDSTKREAQGFLIKPVWSTADYKRVGATSYGGLLLG